MSDAAYKSTNPGNELTGVIDISHKFAGMFTQLHDGAAAFFPFKSFVNMRFMTGILYRELYMFQPLPGSALRTDAPEMRHHLIQLSPVIIE